jgi:protein-S-isoprenylcysteine O-methyltransferase Ste14
VAGEYNKTLAEARLWFVRLVVVGLALVSRPTPQSVALGFPFVALGEGVRFWAAGHLHKTVELITSGPYRYTRNPLYLGRLLILTGVCVMATLPYYLNWAALLVGYVLFFGYYMRRKECVEPARLRETHGEAYERYHEAVPALFPSLKAYPEGATDGWSSDRMLRNKEHLMVVGVIVMTLLLLWRAYSLQV